MVIFLLYQQFDFDSFVYPFHLDSIREVLQEILTRYRGAEEGLSRLDWELYVGGQRRRPRFPVPLIEISMLIGLHNNKERHMAEDKIKNFNFFLSRKMYVLSPCTFDFFPGHVHAENPFLYIDAYHIASVVAFYV